LLLVPPFNKLVAKGEFSIPGISYRPLFLFPSRVDSSRVLFLLASPVVLLTFPPTDNLLFLFYFFLPFVTTFLIPTADIVLFAVLFF